jgi:hypothetical protein
MRFARKLACEDDLGADTKAKGLSTGQPGAPRPVVDLTTRRAEGASNKAEVAAGGEERDFSAAFGLIQQAAEAIRAAEERADELQTRTDRLLQRANHQLKAAEARADAAEQRAEHAEELLFSLHDLIKQEFGRIDVVAV